MPNLKTENEKDAAMTAKPPSPPYVGPAAHDSGPGNRPISRIVIHCTVSPCVEGGARTIAEWFRDPRSQGSAHYVVDPGETVQVVYDSVVAWHAPPNQHSIGIELCDALVSAAWDHEHADRWKDRNHRRMLKRAARLTARLCLAYDVPIARLEADDLRAGKRGLCGHVDVSRAFRQSSHWDPGRAFPWAEFVRLVRKHARRIKAREAARA